MSINEATMTLSTPVFTGEEDENISALGLWQQFLYWNQTVSAMPNETNKEELVRAVVNTLMSAAPQLTITPGYAQASVATPLTPVAPFADTGAVDYDFTFEQFEKRVLELAGVRDKEYN